MIVSSYGGLEPHFRCKSCPMCSPKKWTILFPQSSSYKMSVISAIVLIMVLQYSLVSGFNLDIEKPDVRNGETGSMFGYAVSQHIDQNKGWLLIGAPKTTTEQPGIVKGGAVYRCSVDSPAEPCQILPFDRTGNSNLNNGTHYIDTEEKSNQWFGATVQSSGKDGYILGCAPRYVYHSHQFDKRAIVGTCWLARPGSTAFQEFSPCKKGGLEHDKQGVCEAGLSASFSNGGERLLLGAPGAFYWQGQVYNIYLDRGNSQLSTNEEDMTQDDSYRGYASAVGKFDGDNSEDYVVGVPRGAALLGKIELYAQNLSLITVIEGEQVGAYFGYSVAVEDLDGNRLDDIIVGAPMYSDYSANSYDKGRVYIYYQNNKKKFRPNSKYDILEGQDPKSRFGSAVMGLKDLNRDNYNDIAVGAPYGGIDRKGAVYIYLGSEKGIITKYSQVINAADLSSDLLTFGWSLSGGNDMDKNLYPDLLVGAYSSNQAVFLKARPIVRVSSIFQMDPEKIVLEKKMCEVEFNERKILMACVSVITCVKYAGDGVPKNMDFNFYWKFDTKKKNLEDKRLFNSKTHQVNEEDLNQRLSYNETWCKTSFVYIANDIRDKLTPMTVEFNYEIKERRRRRSLKPILDQYVPTELEVTGNVKKNCGEDDICIPDVWGTAYKLTSGEYIEFQKDNSTIDLFVHVENRGEGAYESFLYIELPPGVEFHTIKNRQYTIPFFYQLLELNDTTFVVLDLGNPFPAKAKANFTLEVRTRGDMDGSYDKLIFNFILNSTNPELNHTYADNEFSISLPLIQKADIIVLGSSVKIPADGTGQVIYNQTGVELYKGTIYGPQISHIYEVRNIGYSDIQKSEINIYWPSFDEFGNHLLFLEGLPEVSGTTKGQCELFVITPFNSSLIWYNEKNRDGKTVEVVLQHHQNEVRRYKRSAAGGRQTREATKKIVCNKKWCTIIRCILGYMKSKGSAKITIKSRIYTETLEKSGLTSEPYYFTSQAVAEIRELPYNIKIDNRTFVIASQEIGTYVNAERLAPRPKSVEPWIIAVAISAGILLLLLLVVLLWWCGFFRRKRPVEDQPFTKPLMTNGNKTAYVDYNSRMYN